MSTIQQLSVFLENREGRLDEVLDALGSNGVNIVALSLADTTEYGMLRMIVSDPERGREELKKIGQLVNIYDAAPHTRNAALDVALSGKMLACTNLGITMTCLADGRRIGFMEDSDIYALFGNILDNAIEATKTVTEEEKRIISLTIGTTGDLLLIDSQNYYAGEVQFVDGLPQTSKENKEYHGFGTRSIKTLTEKYGGDLKISAENGIFRLSIMLPIPT